MGRYLSPHLLRPCAAGRQMEPALEILYARLSRRRRSIQARLAIDLWENALRGPLRLPWSIQVLGIIDAARTSPLVGSSGCFVYDDETARQSHVARSFHLGWDLTGQDRLPMVSPGCIVRRTRLLEPERGDAAVYNHFNLFHGRQSQTRCSPLASDMLRKLQRVPLERCPANRRLRVSDTPPISCSVQGYFGLGRSAGARASNTTTCVGGHRSCALSEIAEVTRGEATFVARENVEDRFWGSVDAGSG